MCHTVFHNCANYQAILLNSYSEINFKFVGLRNIVWWHQFVHLVSQLLVKGLLYEISPLFLHNILCVRNWPRWVNEPHCVKSQAALYWKEVCESEDEWFLHLLTWRFFKYSSYIFDFVLIAKSARTKGKKLEKFIKKKLTIWQVSGRNQRMLLALLPLAFLSGVTRPNPLKFWHW